LRPIGKPDHKVRDATPTARILKTGSKHQPSKTVFVRFPGRPRHQYQAVPPVVQVWTCVFPVGVDMILANVILDGHRGDLFMLRTVIGSSSRNALLTNAQSRGSLGLMVAPFDC